MIPSGRRERGGRRRDGVAVGDGMVGHSALGDSGHGIGGYSVTVGPLGKRPAPALTVSRTEVRTYSYPTARTGRQ